MHCNPQSEIYEYYSDNLSHQPNQQLWQSAIREAFFFKVYKNRCNMVTINQNKFAV